MSANGYPPAPAALPQHDVFDAPWARSRARHRYWLHALLLLATFLTTTIVGAEMARCFARNIPFDADLGGYVRMWRDPSFLLTGLPFSVTLLTILMAHEMGHYLTARHYSVDVTLPFFLPAPTPIGTLGAFIRIRSAILSKRILFDIGIGGPLAGFAVLLGPLAAGVWMSKIVPGIATRGEMIFGTPLLLRIFEMIFWHSRPAADIYLHPVARAAWVGLLATALNLLPIGQLDGGHVLYAFLGERTKWLSRILVGVLVLMGIFVAYSWLVWAALMIFFGMRHPAIVDPSPLGRTRSWLGVLALLILILSFTAAPIRTAGP